MEKQISATIARKAFKLLDELLQGHRSDKIALILGGGTCMVLSHGYPLATMDVDALPLQVSFDEIDPYVKEVGLKLGLSGDWLNPYFSSFTHVLPSDYKDRLIPAFSGKVLSVESLGREDMLILKCFAHRPKDLGHARALIRAGVDLSLVEETIERHQEKGLPMASEALDFLDSLKEEMEDSENSKNSKNSKDGSR